MSSQAGLSSPGASCCLGDDETLCPIRSASTRECLLHTRPQHVMLWSNEAAREDSMPLHSWPAHCNVNLWLLPLCHCICSIDDCWRTLGSLLQSANAEDKVIDHARSVAAPARAHSLFGRQSSITDST